MAWYDGPRCRSPYAPPGAARRNANAGIPTSLNNHSSTTLQPTSTPTTAQPSFVSNPRTIPTQPCAKGFVRRRPKAPPHGASANTPYPFAQVFAPPPHCRRTNRGRFAASTTRCRRYKTLSTLFRHSHVAYFVICERTIVDGHIVDHAGIADGEQGHADFPAEDGLAIPEGKRQYTL